MRLLKELNKKSGMTLIECLVVLGIVGVFLGFMPIFDTHLLSRFYTHTTADCFVNTLLSMRQHALYTSFPYGVFVDETRNIYSSVVFTQQNAPSVIETFALVDGVRITSTCSEIIFRRIGVNNAECVVSFISATASSSVRIGYENIIAQ